MLIYLRNKAGIIIVVIIGIAILSFLLTDAARYGNTPQGVGADHVLKVNGDPISLTEFENQLNLTKSLMRRQYPNASDDEINSVAINNTYDQVLLRKLVLNQAEGNGLKVSPEELYFVIKNYGVGPEISQFFTDPQTGQYNPQLLMDLLKNFDSQNVGAEQRRQWLMLEKHMFGTRIMNKYGGLINLGLHVNELETRREFEKKNRLAAFDYVLVDYNSIEDSEIELTDDDFQAYYEENKKVFVAEDERRNIEYVLFNAIPSSKDTLQLKNKIFDLAARYKKAKNDTTFILVNSELKELIPRYVKAGDSGDDVLDSLIFENREDKFIEPFFSYGSYKMAKVSDYKMSADSVKVRHMLVAINAARDEDKAVAMADSLKNLINLGLESFETLAPKHSDDPGSKFRGGDLGTLGRGVMVQAFEDTMFAARERELTTVKTQFGIHIVEVTERIGQSLHAKLSLVSKRLEPGKETLKKQRNQASDFLRQVSSNGDMATTARQMGYSMFTAEHVLPYQYSFQQINYVRPIIKWAFQAELNDISNEIHQFGNTYVVAKVSKISEKGEVDWRDLRTELTPIVMNRVKAQKIKEALEALNYQSLEQIAQKYNTSVESIENFVEANPLIDFDETPEFKVAGAVFGSSIGEISLPTEGQKGVFVFRVKRFENSNNTYDKSILQGAMAEESRRSSAQFIRDALLKKAKVKDNRLTIY